MAAKAMAADGAGLYPLAWRADWNGAHARRQPSSTRRPRLSRSPPDPEGVATVKRLLDLGADPNAGHRLSDRGPRKPGACQSGTGLVRPRCMSRRYVHRHHVAGVCWLPMAGDPPNRLRKDGHTPFSVAAGSNSLPALKLMAAHGANLKMIYNPGDSWPTRWKPRQKLARIRNRPAYRGRGRRRRCGRVSGCAGRSTDVRERPWRDRGCRTADNPEVCAWTAHSKEARSGKDGDPGAKRIISENHRRFQEGACISRPRLPAISVRNHRSVCHALCIAEILFPARPAQGCWRGWRLRCLSWTQCIRPLDRRGLTAAAPVRRSGRVLFTRTAPPTAGFPPGRRELHPGGRLGTA